MCAPEAFAFESVRSLGSIESVVRVLAGAQVRACVRVQRQERRRIRLVAGVAVSQGAASSCAARARLSVATKEDRVKEDRGGSVMGATWLSDEDGGRVLRGVRCSERGEGRIARNVRMWAPYSPECGGVGAVVARSIYGLVILVF